MKYRLASVSGKPIFLCLQACKMPAVAMLFYYGIKHNRIRHLKPYKAINGIKAQRQNTFILVVAVPACALPA